ncbi:MAG: sugar phosphate isomerase/epimerase [Desulfobacterales bacterium]|nr:MAG: sugar phosphate isomerase/epimerase [Desulfobacterales bacterium]
MSNTYPTLTKSYKGVYPFKLSTTSYIYPDDYIPNIKMLGPFIDEVELLLFESADIESLFSASEISELCRLATNFNLSYNIHLPTDISISDHEFNQRYPAVDTYVRIIERLLPLKPSTFSLHIPYKEDNFENITVKKWRDRVRSNLERLLRVEIDGDVLSIENLDYPVELLEDIIEDLNLSICMDVGHLIRYGHDIAEFFSRYFSKISIIHLHGVENNHDHLSLDRLPKGDIDPILRILKRFGGTVSVEVFSYNELSASLQFLEMCWKNLKSTEV